MCTNKNSEEVRTSKKFSVYNRRESATIQSVDVDKQFLLSYLRARFFLLGGPMIASTPEEVEHVRGLWNNEVKPFIDELDKALGL